MSGICFITKLILSQKDFDILKEIEEYSKSFDDIDYTNINNNDDINNNNEENEINTNSELNIDLINNSNFKEVIEQLKNRGPDYLKVIELFRNKEIKDLDEEKINEYKDLVNIIINNESSILLD